MSNSCNPIDCSLLGFSDYGIIQARILEWIAVSFSRVSSQPRNWTRLSCTAGRFFTDRAMRETLLSFYYVLCGSTSFFNILYSFEYKSLQYSNLLGMSLMWSFWTVVSHQPLSYQSYLPSVFQRFLSIQWHSLFSSTIINYNVCVCVSVFCHLREEEMTLNVQAAILIQSYAFLHSRFPSPLPLQNTPFLGLPGCPVARTLSSRCRESRFNPWLGN